MKIMKKELIINILNILENRDDKMNNNMLQNRAWVEINLNNLKNNIDLINSRITNPTKIMAVVKANAYGHGLVFIAKYLNKINITNFAVATLDEGIKLRENNIKGNILILGYTSLGNIELVKKYDLIQTIVDKEYYNNLVKLNIKIKTHIKVNTGMNRVGISYNDISFIKKIYQDHKLEVLGIYSHFCCADTKKRSDVIFTETQIKRFNEVINKLEQEGINVGKKHLESSYGLLNYHKLPYDYIRCGIIMYGVVSDKKFKPILSLKAKIISIKEITKGEIVGYGRTFKATKKTKIATVSIGYGDGYPRCFSNNKTRVKVNNKYAYIIGNICMDELMIDVTGINVKVGDVVTFIGDDKYLNSEYLAKKANTIPYELLCNLNNRLGYIYQE